MGRKLEWTAYKKFYVREQLSRGVSVLAISHALGCSDKAVAQAVTRYGLRQNECRNCGGPLDLGECQVCADARRLLARG